MMVNKYSEAVLPLDLTAEELDDDVVVVVGYWT